SNVAVIKGTAVTCHQQYLKTQCTSCMCLETGVYYYNTYNNNQINAIHLFDENLDASEVKVFPYQDKLVVQKQN
ncbi:MAG: linear amide C-N hydrolase, partial [Turicibacter sp.]|nr:linear amide C-N hydrolase [Turicibacter sp.]